MDIFKNMNMKLSFSSIVYQQLSIDNIGMNYNYPEANYERTKEIKEHETYHKKLLYFVANDPCVPEEIRTEMSLWGLAKDEYFGIFNNPSPFCENFFLYCFYYPFRFPGLSKTNV